MPRLRKPSRICGTAAAASSRSTVMRTISGAGARQRRDLRDRAIDIGGVGVGHRLHDDRRAPPTATLPTMTCVVLCRALGPATSFCGWFSGLFMASRISGFGDIHQGDGGRAVFFYCQFTVARVPISPKIDGACFDRAIRAAYIGPESRGLKGIQSISSLPFHRSMSDR